MTDNEHSENTREADIREAVRDRYKRLAQKETPCCSSPEEATCSCGGIYPSAEILSLPAEAVAVSAGCGNPAAIAELKEGMVVVDLGSGGGIDAFLASKRVGPTGKVYGIDATPEMIARARKTAKENGFDNVEFRLGEIEHIPLESNVADVVISNCVINLSPNKPHVFKEAFRVLRPGGKLAISDILLMKELPSAIREDMAAWSACVSGAMLEEDYLQAIRNAGFVSEKVVDRQVYSEEQLRSHISTDSFTGNLGALVASCRVSAFKPGA